MANTKTVTPKKNLEKLLAEFPFLWAIQDNWDIRLVRIMVTRIPSTNKGGIGDFFRKLSSADKIWICYSDSFSDSIRCVRAEKDPEKDRIIALHGLKRDVVHKMNQTGTGPIITLEYGESINTTITVLKPARNPNGGENWGHEFLLQANLFRFR